MGLFLFRTEITILGSILIIAECDSTLQCVCGGGGEGGGYRQSRLCLTGQ